MISTYINGLKVGTTFPPEVLGTNPHVLGTNVLGNKYLKHNDIHFILVLKSINFLKCYHIKIKILLLNSNKYIKSRAILNFYKSKSADFMGLLIIYISLWYC